jgi:ketosteroid isomerase-like protein
VFTSGGPRATFGPASSCTTRSSCSSCAPSSPTPGPTSASSGSRSTCGGFLEPWTRLTIEAEEIIEAGDSVVAGICQRGAGSGSGAVTEFRYFQVWTFRGGKVIRCENFRERAEAVETTGLR